MDLTIVQMPNISDCIQFTSTYQINTELTVIAIFKPLDRENSVLLDLYRNDISEANQIVSGKLLQLNTLICQPNREVGFPYYLRCINQAGLDLPLNQQTLQNFYLQFYSFDDGHIKESSSD